MQIETLVTIITIIALIAIIAVRAAITICTIIAIIGVITMSAIIIFQKSHNLFKTFRIVVAHSSTIVLLLKTFRA